jgi:spoIIIJ-associated protein
VPSEGEEAEERAEVVATEEDESAIAAIVAQLMESGDLDVQVEETSRQGKYVNVVLDGKDAAHLVGKHGEVLNALQYLVNVMLTQKRKNGVRATIDGGNYRRKREEALTKLATNIANEVKKRGEEAVLDALPAFERRIVHKVLSEIEGISTYSEGEEPNRRVVIAPVE